MSPTYYGRRVTAAETHFGDLVAGQMRGCVFNAAGQTLWVYAIGGWVGDPDGGTAPTGRFAIYNADVSKNPTTRVGYSASFTASTAYGSASGGASHEPAVDVADNGPTNAALLLYAGQRYAIAFLPTASAARHSMKPAASIVADNEQFYSRSGMSQPPPAPFGSYSAAVEGHMSLWAVGDLQVPPETPATGLAPSGTINSTAPTFTADFLDQNAGHAGGTDRGDRLNQYTIQVRRVSDGVIFWNSTYTALAAEQAADAVSRAYGGTTLVRGTAYEWRIQQSDFVSAWSAWSAWTTFTPANLGFVTLDAAPTGKILDDTPDFQGRWTHQTATTMKTVQVRLLSAGGTVLQTGADFNIADVASSAAPGTLFTVPWADTGLTTLSWDTAYQYQIRGYDGTVWSDWSAARAFTTDAFPTTPSGLAPNGSLITSSLPILAFNLSDPDDTPDASGGNLHGYVVMDNAVSVTNPDLNTNFTGWTAFTPTAGLTVGTNTRATDQAHEGAGSHKVDVTVNAAGAGAIAGAQNTSDITVTPDQSHMTRAHGWVRTEDVNICPRYAIDWYTSGAVYVSTSHQTVYTPSAADTWYENEFSALAPLTAAFGRVVDVWEDRVGGTTGACWFDETGLNGYREATYNAATGRFEFQTTALDFPFKPATVTWFAWGYDETLFGANSGSAVFIYAEGPTISVTAPTEAQVLTSSSVTVTWSVTAGGPQVKYQVRLYADNSATLVYDSGLITDTVTTHVIPSGYVRNETEYDLTVLVENSVPLQGTSAIRNFSIDYADPDPVANVVVGTVQYATDPWPTAIRISWDQTEYATPTWQEYVVTRSASAGVDQTEIVFARITSPTQTAIVDHAPVSGVTYTYTVAQIIIEGLDTLSSVPVEGSAVVDLGGIVLSHATQGETYRTVLRVAQTREHDRQMQEAVYHPVSGNGPLTIRNKTRYWEADIVAKLTGDDWATAAQRREEIEALDAVSPSPTVCFRDDFGRKFYVKLTSLRVADELPAWFTLRLRVRQEYVVEGVV